MKNVKVSKLAKASLVLGMASGIGLVDAHALQQMNYKLLGSGYKVRTSLIEMNNSQGAPIYAAHEEGHGKEAAEHKCGEGTCGEGKKKHKEGEANCGANKGKGHEGSCGANKGKEGGEASCGANKGKSGGEGSCGAGH